METFEPTHPNGELVQPNVGVNIQTQPRVLIASFGDGYETRVADGINTQPRTWDLTYEPISTSIADYIDAFMSARNGYDAFYWKPPRSNDYVKVRCPAWRRNYPTWSHDGIQLSLIEVFDLT